MKNKIVYTFYSKDKSTGDIVCHGEDSRKLYIWLWFQLDKKQFKKVHYVVGPNGVVYYKCPFNFSPRGDIKSLIAQLEKEKNISNDSLGG